MSAPNTDNKMLQARLVETQQDNLPPLQGSVIERSSIGSRLATLGRFIGNVASAFSSSDSGSQDSQSPLEPINLTYEPSSYHLSTGFKKVNYQQVAPLNMPPLGQDAATQVARLQAEAERSSALQQKHQQVVQLFDKMAMSQGLPTYRDWHAQQGLVYAAPSNPDTWGLANLQAKRSPNTNSLIQEDKQQIQSSLAHAQVPKKLLDIQAQVLERSRLAVRAEQKRQAEHRAWAKRKAAEMRRQYAPQQPVTKQAESPRQTTPQVHLTAQIQKAKREALIQQAFYDPRNPEKNILEQTQESEAQPPSKLSQVELNLDHLKSKKKITIEQYTQIAMAAKTLLAENWLRHDGQINEDGTISYRNMKINSNLAPLLAYADADKYWKTDTHLKPYEDWKSQLEKLVKELILNQSSVFLNQGDTWLNLLQDWFFETGASNRVYDANHSITRELMKDEGVQQIRKAWIKAGRPDKFNKGYPFGIKEYARELGTLDGTGSFLGSYNVSIERQANKLIKYTVKNTTGWKSGTHLPPVIRNVKLKKNEINSTVEGMLLRHQPITIPESLLEDRKRSEAGPGGNLVQKYIWYEKE